MAEDEHSLSSLAMRFETQHHTLKKKLQDAENQISEHIEENNKLRLELKLEKFKNNLLSQLISSQTNINVNELWNYTDDGIRIQHLKELSVPILQAGQESAEEIKSVIAVKRKQTKPNFRTVRNLVDLKDENPEEQEHKITEVDNRMEEIAQENGADVSLKDTYALIESSFLEASKSRLYGKCLNAVKEQRLKLFGRLGLEEYTKLIKSHMTRIQSILEKKKHDGKTITTAISKALSPLEQHLASHGAYYSSHIDMDELQKVKVAMKLTTALYPKRYVPYSSAEVLTRLQNYTLALLPLKDNLKRSILNPYGFPNVVYLSLNGADEEDPYSFYTLESVDKVGKRLWKMECRLDDFSKTIALNLKTYCISLFRKIYLDMFADNVYREDYKNKYAIGQQDCAQLLESILLLSKGKEFCNLLRRVVIKFCTIQPAELDKFNFTADDKINKRHFAQETDDEKEIFATIKQLFDDIKDDGIKHFYEGLCA